MNPPAEKAEEDVTAAGGNADTAPEQRAEPLPGTDEEPETRPEADAEPPAQTAEPAETVETVETAELPDFTGQQLQAAQDAAQAAGFFFLTSHDVSGQDRMQVWDRNWQVCTQSPPAGEHPADTEIDFGTVKLEETCP
ncbi:hypothetical protein [Streptomyces specialis]|uniref:hypothetical protein n=1 Tax=Streptomyces specialis TaxID=498367 RepID=UPI000AEA0D16|nr:hypothetical protein [Streptomyces specialis]